VSTVKQHFETNLQPKKNKKKKKKKKKKNPTKNLKNRKKEKLKTKKNQAKIKWTGTKTRNSNDPHFISILLSVLF
jgi:hypothetical protein